MLRSDLCDYADAYVPVKGTITNTGVGDNAGARQADEREKGVIFKSWAPQHINNTGIDTAQDIDILIPMYNLIEYSDNYSKTSGSLWQYYKDDPNDNLTDSESFKCKINITVKTSNDGATKNVEIILPPKYLSNFSRTLEMPLINRKVNLLLTCLKLV